MKQLNAMSLTEEEEAQAIKSVNQLADYINEWARQKGFWNFSLPPTPDGEEPGIKIPSSHYLVKSTKLMLVVTELAEGVEGIRKPVLSQLANYTNEAEEVADAIIRLLDYAGNYGLDIGGAIMAKMAVNEGRPFRHGKGF